MFVEEKNFSIVPTTSVVVEKRHPRKVVRTAEKQTHKKPTDGYLEIEKSLRALARKAQMAYLQGGCRELHHFTEKVFGLISFCIRYEKGKFNCPCPEDSPAGKAWRRAEDRLKSEGKIPGHFTFAFVPAKYDTGELQPLSQREVQAHEAIILEAYESGNMQAVDMALREFIAFANGYGHHKAPLSIVDHSEIAQKIKERMGSLGVKFSIQFAPADGFVWHGRTLRRVGPPVEELARKADRSKRDKQAHADCRALPRPGQLVGDAALRRRGLA